MKKFFGTTVGDGLVSPGYLTKMGDWAIGRLFGPLMESHRRMTNQGH